MAEAAGRRRRSLQRRAAPVPAVARGRGQPLTTRRASLANGTAGLDQLHREHGRLELDPPHRQGVAVPRRAADAVLLRARAPARLGAHLRRGPQPRRLGSSTTSASSRTPTSICGDGVRTPTESCDEGSANADLAGPLSHVLQATRVRRWHRRYRGAMRRGLARPRRARPPARSSRSTTAAVARRAGDPARSCSDSACSVRCGCAGGGASPGGQPETVVRGLRVRGRSLNA